MEQVDEELYPVAGMGMYPGYGFAPVMYNPQAPQYVVTGQPLGRAQPMYNVPWPQEHAGHVALGGGNVYIDQRQPLAPNRPIVIAREKSQSGDTIVNVRPAVREVTREPTGPKTTLPSAWTFLDDSSKKVIGQGSFGVVSLYELLDGCGSSPVTVKKIKALDSKTREEAKQEAQLQKMLSHHPNVCQLFDHGPGRTSRGTSDGAYYTLMEAVGGGELKDHIEKNVDAKLAGVARTAEEKAAWFWRLSAQILAGVRFLHESGVYHRDLKPDNILVTHPDCFTNPECQVKIIDFGLSCKKGPDSPKACAAGAMGTPDYMSPEVLLDMQAAQGKVDAYAIGVTLWKLWHGSTSHPIQGMYQTMATGGFPALQNLIQRWKAKGTAQRLVQTRDPRTGRSTATYAYRSTGGTKPYMEDLSFASGTPEPVRHLLTGLLLPDGNKRWTVAPGRVAGLPDALTFAEAQILAVRDAARQRVADLSSRAASPAAQAVRSEAAQAAGITDTAQAEIEAELALAKSAAAEVELDSEPPSCVEHCVDVAARKTCTCSAANEWCTELTSGL